MKIVKMAIRVIVFVIGGFLLLWGLFCLMGGPDAQIFSKESFFFGGIYSLAGIICFFIQKKIS
jgi:hypothetical protein